MKDFKEFLVEGKITKEEKKIAVETWDKVLHDVWDKSVNSIKKYATITSVKKYNGKPSITKFNRTNSGGVLASLSDADGKFTYDFYYTFADTLPKTMTACVSLPMTDRTKAISNVLKKNLKKYVESNQKSMHISYEHSTNLIKKNGIDYDDSWIYVYFWSK